MAQIKKKTYRHLSLAEREEIYALQKAGWSLGDIAKKISRDKGTLSREFKRNRTVLHGLEKTTSAYIPYKADEKAKKRAVKQRSEASWKGPEVWQYVKEKLKKHWSPETIAGRITIDHPGISIHHETIYQMVYAKGHKKDKLWEYLPLARKKRMKKDGRRVHRHGKIPEAISIEKRPKYIQKRKQGGHWETDNVIGQQSDQTALSVTVERVARLSLLNKLPNRSADAKRYAVSSRIRQFPKQLRRTLTTDNGKENTQHKRLTEETGVTVYFTHAYASWEKGSVENMNQRIRRYLPKGTSLDSIPEEQIVAIEHAINSTPRKCLGYLTPYEKMRQLLSL